jgi:hypothetical protein
MRPNGEDQSSQEQPAQYPAPDPRLEHQGQEQLKNQISEEFDQRLLQQS